MDLWSDFPKTVLELEERFASEESCHVLDENTGRSSTEPNCLGSPDSNGQPYSSIDIMSRPQAFSLAAGAISLGLTLVLYGRTSAYGFDWDDYHFVRPYVLGDVAATFVGPWDTTGIEPRFYRPLTITLYAARVWALGMDPWRLHALSLVLFVAAALLFAALLQRLGLGAVSALAGLVAFLVHPLMSISAVSWVTNQMHEAGLLVTLTALLWWTVCHDRGVRWWMPLLGLQLVAVLLKEDGIMLAPILVAVHAVDRWTRRDRAPWLAPWPWVVATGGLLAAYLGLRHWALGGLGGYDRTDGLIGMIRNLKEGPVSALLLVPRDDLPLERIVGLAVPALGATGVTLWLTGRRDRISLMVVLAGLVILLIANAPFALTTKPHQFHILAMATSLALAGVAQLLMTDPRGLIRLWGSTMIAVLLVAMAGVTWHAATHFAPCSRKTRQHDQDVATWGNSVAPELRALLAAKPMLCGDAR